MTAAAIAPATEFDPAELERFLTRTLPNLSSPMTIERVAGGQSNPTFFLGFGTNRFVLRKQPQGDLLPSAHAIDREYRVMRALAQTGVPVPDALLFCEDRSVVGTPFYIMRRVEGRVFHDCALGAAPREERREMYRSLARMLAALHTIPPESVGLNNYGRHENYFGRQITRWSRQWELSRSDGDANIDHLIEWLPRNIPGCGLHAISHGDYRIGNVIFHPRQPRIVAVLDWELSTLGHPLADLAHCCIAWHIGADEYGGIRRLDLPAFGLPPQSEFEDWYHTEAGHGQRLEPFHLAFALFRFSVVFAGIEARAKAGNAAGADAAKLGCLSRVFAERAVALIG